MPSILTPEQRGRCQGGCNVTHFRWQQGSCWQARCKDVAFCALRWAGRSGCALVYTTPPNTTPAAAPAPRPRLGCPTPPSAGGRGRGHGRSLTKLKNNPAPGSPIALCQQGYTRMVLTRGLLALGGLGGPVVLAVNLSHPLD